MLVRLFALRSRALNALIGLEPGTHRLVPTATVLPQTGLGCLRKSTACTVSPPRRRQQKWTRTARFLGGQDASGRVEPRLAQLAGPSPAGRQMK
jgi:hypothetical protein